MFLHPDLEGLQVFAICSALHAVAHITLDRTATLKVKYNIARKGHDSRMEPSGFGDWSQELDASGWDKSVGTMTILGFRTRLPAV